MTSDFNTDKVREAANDILDKERNYKEALRLLLDWQRDREHHTIALPANMGSSKSYLVSVSLGWIAANVYFSRDLPIFKEHKREDTGAININATTAVYLQQREPDYSRQLPMAMYLATREHHKFPPLLLVAYQDWVYDQGNDNWGPDGGAMKGSLNVESLDTKACVVDLDVMKTSYFALDGQHRLMAIKGLKELLDNGRLSPKRKDGSSVSGKDVTREEIEGYYEERGLELYRLQNAMDEVMGVEIIPAVQDRETFGEAVSRLRNVFVDVNETAKRLEKGRLALLDENDGFRIVARTVMTKHKLFKRSSGSSLNVDTESNQLSESSESYTTLNALVSITESYLGTKPEFERWKNAVLGLRGSRGVGLLRPTDDEVENGLVVMTAYFDALAKLPSHRHMIAYFDNEVGVEGAAPSKLRGGNEQNILFRPTAQVALARAAARLEVEQGANLTELVEILSKHEESGDLHLTRKTAPWFGILCDPVEEKIRRNKQYEDLCTEMLIYLLGGGFFENDEREERLCDDFFNARKGTADSDEPEAWSISGSLKKRGEFGLPATWW